MLRRRSFLKYATMAGAGAAFSFAFPSFSAAVASEKKGHTDWDYDQNGENWGGLSPDFRTCEMGTQQSPINLQHQGALHAEDLNDLEFNYHQSALSILNNGHTVQVNPDPDNHLKISGQNFDLVQFHFHHPSEHTVNDKHYPMEAHLVHRNKETGELAVLGVFFALGHENKNLNLIWSELPEHKTEAHPIVGEIDLERLLPQQKLAYRYNGSLTTPPCSQIVRWIVFEKAVEASGGQLQKFAKIFPNNARPTQDNNHRLIIEG